MDSLTVVRCAGSARPVHRSRRARAATNSPRKKRLLPCNRWPSDCAAASFRSLPVCSSCSPRASASLFGPKQPKRPLAYYQRSSYRIGLTAEPAFALERGSSPNSPPTDPSWRLVPPRERFADLAPVVCARGYPGDQPGRPTPDATGRRLPALPTAPAPADRLFTQKATACSTSPAAAQCWANSAGCANTVSGKRSFRVAAIRACSRWRRLRSKVS